MDSFKDFEPEFDRPASTSIEIQYQKTDAWKFAARLEKSRELEEYPETRYGLFVGYKLDDNISFGLEYLYAEFEQPRIEDETQIEGSNLVTLEIVLEF